MTPADASPPTVAIVARCLGLAAAADGAAADGAAADGAAVDGAAVDGAAVQEEAAGAFEAALRAYAQAPDAFELARTRLMYGATLRRSENRVAARAQLRPALDAFWPWT